MIDAAFPPVRQGDAMISRRALLKAAGRAALLPPAATLIASSASFPTRSWAGPPSVTMRIGDAGPTRPISPFIYGSNELGRMDGGVPSVDFDRPVRTPFRRLGGNLMTTYNWTNNAQNAGKDWHQANVFAMADMLDLSPEQRAEPAAVIAAMHRNSLALGAQSLVTLQLAGYVAADADGEVPEAEHAPSKRFVPLKWQSDAAADAPIDKSHADIPQLVRRLVATFGNARSPTGIRAYALDNEPGLWSETHPRIVTEKPTIKSLIERSLLAAKAIKAIDPHALVFGPASWGATEFQNFQNAPDWPAYQHYGSFLAAYLDAFSKESAKSGIRLLDVLDVHWYPFSPLGDLLHSDNPAHAEVLLNAPRSLTEPGFREDSWVSQALPVSNTAELALPILPSLHRLIDKWYPGTELAVTEFNYGGTGELFTGLAVADALGRLGTAKVNYANHWGPLRGMVGNAYKLYRNYDGKGGAFPAQGIEILPTAPHDLSVYGAVDGTRLHLIAINRGTSDQSLQLDLQRQYRTLSAYGFDAGLPEVAPIGKAEAPFDAETPLVLPARSARHFVLSA
jgi:mannan endo-1,4-beta-mannosidase